MVATNASVKYYDDDEKAEGKRGCKRATIISHGINQKTVFVQPEGDEEIKEIKFNSIVIPMQIKGKLRVITKKTEEVINKLNVVMEQNKHLKKEIERQTLIVDDLLVTKNEIVFSLFDHNNKQKKLLEERNEAIVETLEQDRVKLERDEVKLEEDRMKFEEQKRVKIAEIAEIQQELEIQKANVQRVRWKLEEERNIKIAQVEQQLEVEKETSQGQKLCGVWDQFFET